ncbi:MAG: lipoyl(octanoyl) transferase LipB [Candidatus Eremiobacteraeota bacterium]|nr:lipoyl(octanoyl) transferase LipB [Candidatus Eremiobacteraeota bacterium]MBV8374820.1 lipoyl(octanoyl) transferase LipB [Candidatus Eremiobacteraeota bacterium]
MIQARLLDLGLRPYREVWALQRRIHEAVVQGLQPDTWIVVQHLPVITLGRQAKRENVLLSDDALRARGVEIVAIERGGDVTYHGPGQIVVYPIRKLDRFREIVPLVRALEGAVIDTCAHFGVIGERWSEHAGVWVGGDQICAIGLAVRQMVSLHGIALNVSTQLTYDALINPCGLTEHGITSLSKEAGRAVSVEEAKAVLLEELARTFEVTFIAEPEQMGA